MQNFLQCDQCPAGNLVADFSMTNDKCSIPVVADFVMTDDHQVGHVSTVHGDITNRPHKAHEANDP